MKLVVDENIPMRSVTELRGAGHEVIDIRGTSAQGAPDDVLWATAQQAAAVLITTDKGFARTLNEPHHGVLVIRLRQPNRQRIHER